MFDKIAKYYDLIMSPFDYQELVNCLDDLIISNGGERTNILDLGCGTSEELLYFMQLGYEISGIDSSAEMIEISKDKLKNGNFKVGDMRNFKTKKKFDNVISVFDSLNYLTDPKEMSKCFISVNNALNNGGLFLFDFNSIYGLVNEWEGIKIEETEDFFISYDSTFDTNRLILECDMRFFIKDESGKFISFEETHYERGYSPDEIKDLLKHNGFQLVKILPFLSRKPTRNPKLDRYQIVARKTEEVRVGIRK
ncbi:MAG: methyltransferase domain-containing protein [Candidatus Delongbacteria bacterium]|nr:methyltransferase domain-containing protein [Candidatus Delongbacteria bacterium]